MLDMIGTSKSRRLTILDTGKGEVLRVALVYAAPNRQVGVIRHLGGEDASIGVIANSWSANRSWKVVKLAYIQQLLYAQPVGRRSGVKANTGFVVGGGGAPPPPPGGAVCGGRSEPV
jgi:hypothetical protein